MPEEMPDNLRRIFEQWCQTNRANIFTNGQGSVILFNYPYELEMEFQKYFPHVGNLLESDVMSRGVMVPSYEVPIRLRPQAKITDATANEIRSSRAGGMTIRDLAALYQISTRTVQRYLKK